MLSLCLQLSSLSLYLINVAVLVISYGLECVTNLDIVYISFSAHILFDYKLVLLILYLGFKHSLVFYTLFELSVMSLDETLASRS